MTPEESQLHQAHGLSKGQMKRIAMAQGGQIPGGIKKLPPNNWENLKDKYFHEDLDGYTVSEHEKNIYHIAQETRSFHAATGEKISKASVQKYDKKTFKFMKDNDGFKGMTIAILHDPTLGMKEYVDTEKEELLNKIAELESSQQLAPSVDPEKEALKKRIEELEATRTAPPVEDPEKEALKKRIAELESQQQPAIQEEQPFKIAQEPEAKQKTQPQPSPKHKSNK